MATRVHEAYYSNAHKTACHFLIALFRDRESIENAYNTIREHGYRTSDIWMILSDETRRKFFSGDTDLLEKPEKYSVEEINTYLMNNNRAGIMSAINAGLVLSNLNIIATGSFALELTKGEVKTVEEILMRMSIPEQLVEPYELGIKAGNVLMMVAPRNEQEASYFEKNWKGNYALEINKVKKVNL